MEKYNFNRLLKETNSPEKEISFLQKFGIIPKTVDCAKCGKALAKVFKVDDYVFFRCSCPGRPRVSVMKHTLLYSSTISISVFLVIVYGFIQGWKYTTGKNPVFIKTLYFSLVIEESDLENEVPGTGKQMSSATVAKFFKIFRSN